MLFNSIGFMFFFPIVVLLYFLFPKKYRYLWLLSASYFFYLCWDIKYVFFLIFSTLTTYVCARLMHTKNKKLLFILCIVFNVSLLCTFKHGLWGINILTRIISVLGLQISAPAFDIILPIGLSFYVLQSLGYLIDVYRGNCTVETNFAKYALFVSFFPTILSGPIERSGNLLKQIQAGTDFSYNNAKNGLLLMFWGFFEKLLIANRISPLVNKAYENHSDFTGATLAFAVFLYAIQIYADFAGYSHITIGTSKVLGFELLPNFKQPYFSTSIKEFWRRWHISLSSWLRDYVYISMGGSRCSKLKTYRNLVVTFLISGFWHGTGFTYIIWGALHGMYQVVGSISSKTRSRIQHLFKINTNCWSYRLYQSCITFILVDFAWLFFRATSMSQALGVIQKILFDFRLGATLSHQTYLLGMNETRFFILIIEVLILLLVDTLHEKDFHIIPWFNRQNLVFRWLVYLFITTTLLIGIIYNYGVDASTFIYSQF